MVYRLKQDDVVMEFNTDYLNVDLMEKVDLYKVVLDTAPLSGRGYWLLGIGEISFLGPVEDPTAGLATTSDIFEFIKSEGYKIHSVERTSVEEIRAERFWEDIYFTKMIELGYIETDNVPPVLP